MEESQSENLLCQQATKFQQIFYELCSDYHTFCCDDFNEGIEHLKNFIGYTLFGLHLPTDNDEQLHIIEMLYNKIIENSNDKSTIYCGLIFNVVYFAPNRDNSYNCIYPIPIFKVGNFQEDKHLIKCDGIPVNTTYIDIGGRVYEDWQKYLTKNTLKNMTMIVPYKGIYSLNPAFCSGRFTSSVHIEKILSETTNDPNCIMEMNCGANMTLVSGGVSILLGGCWQNTRVKDRMVQKLLMYITIDNITVHGFLDTFDPPTLNTNYINYGKLIGTDVLKLSKHIMYIGNCIVPEEVLRNLLMNPNDISILFEYEAQFREIRHTTEHMCKRRNASNNAEENSQKSKLIIRELKTIKTREDMLMDLTIYNITEIINREDIIKVIKLNSNKDITNKINEEKTAEESMDVSVKPYVEKVLECLKEVFMCIEEIPPPQMKELVQSVTGIKNLGIGWNCFTHLMTVVSNIIHKVPLEKLKSSIASIFILIMKFLFHSLRIFLPMVEKLLPTSFAGKIIFIIINIIYSYMAKRINDFADFLAEKICPYIV